MKLMITAVAAVGALALAACTPPADETADDAAAVGAETSTTVPADPMTPADGTTATDTGTVNPDGTTTPPGQTPPTLPPEPVGDATPTTSPPPR